MIDVLPNDSDGDALRRLISHGSDLSQPMKIDFAVAVPNEDAGKAVASRAESLGFRPDLYHNPETGAWTCYCSKTMIPTYDKIIAAQSELDELSQPFGGKSDGWGSFGNAELDP
jgi:hypothetical protein